NLNRSGQTPSSGTPAGSRPIRRFRQGTVLVERPIPPPRFRQNRQSTASHKLFACMAWRRKAVGMAFALLYHGIGRNPAGSIRLILTPSSGGKVSPMRASRFPWLFAVLFSLATALPHALAQEENVEIGVARAAADAEPGVVGWMV